MSKHTYIVYDSRSVSEVRGRQMYGLPVGVHTLEPKKVALLLEYPDTHVVLHLHNDEAGTITQDTIEGIRWECSQNPPMTPAQMLGIDPRKTS